jgi:hypothetical protein
MKKRTFYLTMGFFLICLIGIALAIRDINTTVPQSEEGALLEYTCNEVKSYETLAAEQDLEELKQLMIDHINGYASDPQGQLSAAMNVLDSLKDEVAFHNTDQTLYRTQFRKILRLISRAELVKAQGSLSKGQQDAALESVRHAQHCLHDALIFSSKEEIDADMDLLHELNEAKNNGLTAEGLEKVMSLLAS